TGVQTCALPISHFSRGGGGVPPAIAGGYGSLATTPPLPAALWRGVRHRAGAARDGAGGDGPGVTGRPAGSGRPRWAPDTLFRSFGAGVLPAPDGRADSPASALLRQAGGTAVEPD